MKYESTQSGSVRRKGDKWYYRFRMQEPDGTWKLKEFKGGKTKRETLQMLKDDLADYQQHGVVFHPGSITVNDLGEDWYHSEVENSALTTNGRNDYKNILRHIREHPLGEKKLSEVTVSMLQAYIDEKTYGKYDSDGCLIRHAYSESHMRKQRLVMNNMFKFAVYPRQYLRENPMQYVKRRKKEEKAVLFGDPGAIKVDTITTEEYYEIVDHLEASDTNRYLALPIHIAFHTGMRAGEVCGLTWEDIDFKNMRIHVRRTMYYDNNTFCWELKVPKSKKSRDIEFGEQLAQILKSARKKQLEYRMRYGNRYHNHFYRSIEEFGRQHVQVITQAPVAPLRLGSRVTRGLFMEDIEDTANRDTLYPVAFVCSKDDGELLTPQTLRYCNKLVQKEMPHISHFHFHALRHTYASTLVNHGANIKDVQMLLGHSDIKITLDTYSHTTSETRKKAVGIFETAIAR